jgi:hypothetical protein
MEVVAREVTPTLSRTFPFGEGVRLGFVGDIQYNGRGGHTDMERLRRHVAWLVENDAYVVIMGDVVDTFSPSNRQRLRAANLYDAAEIALEMLLEQLEQEVFEALAPLEGRVLAVLEGHHYLEHADGTTTDIRLAKRLGAPFVGRSAFIGLRFVQDGKVVDEVTVYAIHPDGAAATISGIVASVLRRQGGFAADLFAVAHYHQRGAWAVSSLTPSLSPQRPTVRDREVWFVLTGSFMRGYDAAARLGERIVPSYVERKWLLPNALGAPVVHLAPVVDGRRRYVDIRPMP